MGFNQSHLAVYQCHEKTILDALGFFPTGEKEEVLDSNLVSATLPGGWFIVVARWDLPNLAHQSSIQSLSRDYRVITGSVSEMGGASSLDYWEDGTKLWGIDYLSCRRQVFQNFGQLPPEHQIVSDRHRQLGVDGLDRDLELAPEIGEAITGYLFGREASDLGIDGFDVLKPPAKPEKQSFLKRLLGIAPSIPK